MITSSFSAFAQFLSPENPTLTTGEVVRGEFGGYLWRVEYEFDGQAGDVVDFTVAFPNAGLRFIETYALIVFGADDPNAIWYWYSDDVTVPLPPPVVLPSDGRYQLVIGFPTAPADVAPLMYEIRMDSIAAQMLAMNEVSASEYAVAASRAFHFDGTVGTPVTIVAGTSEQPAQMALFVEAQALPVAMTSTSGDTADMAFEYVVLPASGRYTLVITYGGDEDGTISVQLLPLTLASISYGSCVNITFTPERPVYAYAFAATELDRLNVTVSGEAGFDTALTLVDAAARQHFDDNSGPGYDPKLNVDTEITGWAVVTARSRELDREGRGRFCLEREGTVLLGNDQESARVRWTPDTNGSSIVVDGVAGAGYRAVFNVSPYRWADVQIIVAQNGVELARIHAANEAQIVVAFVLPADGTFVINIRDRADVIQDVSFDIERLEDSAVETLIAPTSTPTPTITLTPSPTSLPTATATPTPTYVPTPGMDVDFGEVVYGEWLHATFPGQNGPGRHVVRFEGQVGEEVVFTFVPAWYTNLGFEVVAPDGHSLYEFARPAQANRESQSTFVSPIITLPTTGTYEMIVILSVNSDTMQSFPQYRVMVNRAEVRPLVMNEALEGHLDEQNRQVILEFTGLDAAAVSILALADSQHYTMSLYAGDADETWRLPVEAVVPQAGSHLVDYLPLPDTTLTYRLILTVIGDDAVNYAVSVHPAALQTIEYGEVVDVNFSPQQPVALFTLDHTLADVIDVSAAGIAGFDTALNIYPQVGIARPFDDDGGAGLNPEILFYPLHYVEQPIIALRPARLGESGSAELVISRSATFPLTIGTTSELMMLENKSPVYVTTFSPEDDGQYRITMTRRVNATPLPTLSVVVVQGNVILGQGSLSSTGDLTLDVLPNANAPVTITFIGDTSFRRQFAFAVLVKAVAADD